MEEAVAKADALRDIKAELWHEACEREALQEARKVHHNKVYRKWSNDLSHSAKRADIQNRILAARSTMESIVPGCDHFCVLMDRVVNLEARLLQTA